MHDQVGCEVTVTCKGTQARLALVLRFADVGEKNLEFFLIQFFLYDIFAHFTRDMICR